MKQERSQSIGNWRICFVLVALFSSIPTSPQLMLVAAPTPPQPVTTEMSPGIKYVPAGPCLPKNSCFRRGEGGPLSIFEDAQTAEGIIYEAAF